MAAKSVQIEVCDQITKVCRVEKKGKKVRISDAFLFKTPEASVQDGVIVNPAVLGEELTNQLAAHGLGNVKNAVFALSSNKIAVREARLPYMKPKLVGSAVMTNAQEYFPVDLQNYTITFSILDSFTGADGFVRGRPDDLAHFPARLLAGGRGAGAGPAGAPGGGGTALLPDGNLCDGSAGGTAGAFVRRIRRRKRNCRC